MRDSEQPVFCFLPGREKLFFTTSSSPDSAEPVSYTRIYQKKLCNTDLSSAVFRKRVKNTGASESLKETDKLTDTSLRDIYCSDLEGVFNLLRPRHRFLHLVNIDTNQEWQQVERGRHTYGYGCNTYICYARGIMARNISIRESYDLCNVEDIDRLAELGLFNFKPRTSSSPGTVLCQWALKNLYLDIALKLRPYTSSITTITDLYFTLEDEPGLCHFLQQKYLLDYIQYPEYLLPKVAQKNWRQAATVIKDQYQRQAHSARDDRLLSLLQPYFSTTEEVRCYMQHSCSFLYALLKSNNSQYQCELLLLALFKKQSSREDQQWLIGLLQILSQQQQTRGIELVFKRYKTRLATYSVPLSNFAFKSQDHRLQEQLKTIDAYRPTASQALKPDTQAEQFSEEQMDEFVKACQLGETQTVSDYIHRGIDLDLRKGTGIQLACKHSQLECVKLLLEAGATPDPWASYTIKYANKNCDYALARLLMDYGLEDKHFTG